jgi:ribosomal protein S18 acetylase RimI-like enzyme
MNSILIRPANSADVDTLNRFQQEIIAAERPFDPTIKDDPVQYYDTAQMLASEQVQFVVAESGSQIIGCGFARIERSKHYLAHANHGYLGMMYVDPKYRGQSVSKRIIDALKEWCLSKNLRELRLEVYHGNDSAVKAYEKSGFRRLMTEMRLDLRPL